jgi:hypothetical protein
MNDLVLGEYFRPEVSLEFFDSHVVISYALWQVTLPADWVGAHPAVEQFLQRRIGRSAALLHPVAQPLVKLLDAQGCFTPVAQATYTLREVKALFDPLRSQWYAHYYAHPAWEQLREGRANVSMLFTWLIHNYHISRAAGTVAARMASTSADSRWAHFFRDDALAEYWHCDAFYSLQSKQLAAISLQQIKDYVPLASSMAFEEHTLRVAETDPLGHLLIAYFQESSIAFVDDSRAFYRSVEEHYDIAGFFSPWEQHIQIDVDQGHADGLGKLFESDDTVSEGTLAVALRNAWLAYRFLSCGLDDIVEAGAQVELSMRPPQRLANEVCDLLGLADAFLVNAGSTVTLRPADVASLRRSLSTSAFRALGHARQHDEIIACGRWAQCLAQAAAPEVDAVATLWKTAIDNHLQEAACRPLEWLLLTKLLSERAPQLQLGKTWSAALDQLLRAHPASARAATALFQLDELLSRSAQWQAPVPAELAPVLP